MKTAETLQIFRTGMKSIVSICQWCCRLIRVIYR